jgi:hypothetical protein
LFLERMYVELLRLRRGWPDVLRKGAQELITGDPAANTFFAIVAREAAPPASRGGQSLAVEFSLPALGDFVRLPAHRVPKRFKRHI